MYNNPPSVPVLPKEYYRWTPEQREFYEDWWLIISEYVDNNPVEYPPTEKHEGFIHDQVWKMWRQGTQPPED